MDRPGLSSRNIAVFPAITTSGTRRGGDAPERWDGRRLAEMGLLDAPQTSELIAGSVPIPSPEDTPRSLARLSREMARPFPDPKVVEQQSRQTARLLGGCLVKLAATRFDGDNVRQFIDKLDRNDARDHVEGWDQAAQLYLALVPLRQTWVAMEPEREADQVTSQVTPQGSARKTHLSRGLRQPERL